MAHPSSIALPGLAGLHNARTDERAFFWADSRERRPRIGDRTITSRGGQQLIKIMGVVTAADGRIGWEADGMSHRSSIALPGVVGLHDVRTDERAVFFGRIYPGEGAVSAIEQLESRAEQHSIENMDVVTCAGGGINIGRNALRATGKSTHSDRTATRIGLRSSNHRQIQIGAGAIRGVDRLVVLHAERLAAIRFADLGCGFPRKFPKNMPVARLIGLRQEVARRAGLNLRIGKLQRLRARRLFDVAHALAFVELCDGTPQNVAPVDEVSQTAIDPVAICAATEFGLGKKICSPDKDRAATVHALRAEQLQSSSRADVISARIRSLANPNPAFRAFHGGFHPQRRDCPGIEQNLVGEISPDTGKAGRERTQPLAREAKVSRLVKYTFHYQTSVRHKSKDGGELFVCFGPESSRDARDGFAETWRRGTNVYRGLRSLRQRVKARVLDIAQEISHGQGGFAKRAVMVEHPSGQHCFGGFFEPLINQNSNFSSQICRVVQTGQLKALQRSARRRAEIVDRGSDARYGHGQTPKRTGLRTKQLLCADGSY